MDAKQRLLDLLNAANFKIIDSSTSVQEFKETVSHNQEQYAMIEAMGEHYKERILDLICLVLAEKLHPMARDRYGDTGQPSLHRILTECFNTPEIKSQWGACKQTALMALRGDGFDKQKLTVMSNVIDDLPEVLIDILVQLAGNLKVVPMQEVSGVSKILVQMIKEGAHVNNKRNN